MGFKIKFYNTNVQIGAMKSHYPYFKVIKHADGDIEFIGNLLIKPELPIYKVSITYRGDYSPIIKILTPQLVEHPKHFYSNTQSLCLYHPYEFKWRKEKLIAKYIVPWTSAWIYFYEVWLQTGTWYGPEIPHDNLKIQL